MTVVIADTSPLNYLILIEAIDLLPGLYKRIIIPAEVLGELIDDGAPGQVREWAIKLPKWVEVRSAPANDPALSFLDSGERSAILLAETEAEVLLLIDETAGRLACPVDRDQLSDFKAALGRTDRRGCSQRARADKVAKPPL